MNTEIKKIITRDGVNLNIEVKETGCPVWIIATHGIGEHQGRHRYLSDLFSHSFNVCTYDLRGHGKSGGVSGYVDKFSDYMEDLDELIAFLREKYKMKKYILFGHSMGALITSAYVQKYAKEDFYPEKVIINAPPVGVPGVLGEIVKFSPLQLFSGLAKMPLSLKLGGLVDLEGLSHDVRVKEDYVNDELNHKKLHSKLLIEMVKCTKEVFSRPIRPKCSAVCSYGTKDTIVSPEAIVQYFSMVEKSFKIKVINDAKHEIHNEVDKYRAPYFEYLKEEFSVVLTNQ